MTITIYSEESREAFAVNYPEAPHKLAHNLHTHPLLTLEALARLGDSLPRELIECNLGDQPIGVDAVPEQLKDNVGERILNIGAAGSWVGLREVDRDPAYRALLHELLEEMRPAIEKKTGPILDIQGFIFITSPGGVTPYHFDPEHNILLQVRGSKIFTMFPAGDPFYAPDEIHEAYHIGGRPELPWRDELSPGGVAWSLKPGDALFVPVMSPHFVKGGDEISISVSVVWRSEWSHAEADARSFNRLLRKAGISPSRPGRWPEPNRAKAYAWRALRKIGAVG
jgi:hypothetical protein